MATAVALSKTPPPPLGVKREKEYSANEITLQNEPYIVIKEKACTSFLHSLRESDIVGVNFAGMMAILNGAVPPETPWLRYLHTPLRGGKAQPAGYIQYYPKQCQWLAFVQNALLKEQVGARTAYTSEVLATTFGPVGMLVAAEPPGKFMAYAKSTVSFAPAFTSDLVEKYMWVIKKFNITKFDELLDMLKKEEDTVIEDIKKNGNQLLPTVEDMYDYTEMRKGLTLGASGASGSSGVAASSSLQIQPSPLALPRRTSKELQKDLEKTMGRWVEGSDPTELRDNIRSTLEANGRKWTPEMQAAITKATTKKEFKAAVETIVKESQKEDVLRESIEKVITDVAQKLASHDTAQQQEVLRRVVEEIVGIVGQRLAVPQGLREAVEAVVAGVAQRLANQDAAQQQEVLRRVLEEIVGIVGQRLAVPQGLREAVEAVVAGVAQRLTKQDAAQQQEVLRRVVEEIVGAVGQRLAVPEGLREAVAGVVAGVAQQLANHDAAVQRQTIQQVVDQVVGLVGQRLANQDMQKLIEGIVRELPKHLMPRQIDIDDQLRIAIGDALTAIARELAGPISDENLQQVVESIVGIVAERLGAQRADVQEGVQAAVQAAMHPPSFFQRVGKRVGDLRKSYAESKELKQTREAIKAIVGGSNIQVIADIRNDPVTANICIANSSSVTDELIQRWNEQKSKIVTNAVAEANVPNSINVFKALWWNFKCRPILNNNDKYTRLIHQPLQDRKNLIDNNYKEQENIEILKVLLHIGTRLVDLSERVLAGQRPFSLSLQNELKAKLIAEKILKSEQMSNDLKRFKTQIIEHYAQTDPNALRLEINAAIQKYEYAIQLVKPLTPEELQAFNEDLPKLNNIIDVLRRGDADVAGIGPGNVEVQVG